MKKSLSYVHRLSQCTCFFDESVKGRICLIHVLLGADVDNVQKRLFHNVSKQIVAQSVILRRRLWSTSTRNTLKNITNKSWMSFASCSSVCQCDRFRLKLVEVTSVMDKQKMDKQYMQVLVPQEIVKKGMIGEKGFDCDWAFLFVWINRYEDDDWRLEWIVACKMEHIVLLINYWRAMDVIWSWKDGSSRYVIKTHFDSHGGVVRWKPVP